LNLNLIGLPTPHSTRLYFSQDRAGQKGRGRILGKNAMPITVRAEPGVARTLQASAGEIDSPGKALYLQ